MTIVTFGLKTLSMTCLLIFGSRKGSVLGFMFDIRVTVFAPLKRERNPRVMRKGLGSVIVHPPEYGQSSMKVATPMLRHTP
jgi:hypothetical protein